MAYLDSGERAMNDNDAFSPPYGIAWRTFLNALDKMAEHPLPPTMDRSYLTWMPGSAQTYYLSAARGFGLISGADDTVTLPLRKLVSEPLSRPQIIAELLQQRYTQVIELAGTNATAKALLELWRERYGQEGETRRKAISFYLQAANYANVPVSPHWESGMSVAARPAGSSKPRPRRTRKATAKTAATEPPAPETNQAPGKFHVQLASGGHLTVLADVDVFTLSPDDRQFLFGIIDALQTYTKQHPGSSEQEPPPADPQPADDEQDDAA